MNTTTLLTREQKLNAWGEGEWIDEPDMVQFEHQGFKCEVKRIACLEYDDTIFGGHLCGYISVEKNHPWFDYNWEAERNEATYIDIDIHGGISYLEPKGDLWELGFDCAHSCDITPSMEHLYKTDARLIEIRRLYPVSPIWTKSYKNINFVIEECKSLAEQAKNAEILECEILGGKE